MMRGKCDSCNKLKATGEYLVVTHYAHTLKFCNVCKPKYKSKNITLIYGK